MSYLLQGNKDYGVELAASISGLLVAAMAKKAIKTGKPVPVTLTVLGLVGAAYYGKKWYEQGGI